MKQNNPKDQPRPARSNSQRSSNSEGNRTRPNARPSPKRKDPTKPSSNWRDRKKNSSKDNEDRGQKDGRPQRNGNIRRDGGPRKDNGPRNKKFSPGNDTREPRKDMRANHSKPLKEKPSPVAKTGAFTPSDLQPRGSKDFSAYVQPRQKTFSLLQYESFAHAKNDSDNIKNLCLSSDQINVVIRAEGNMDDPELLGLDSKVKVFAGEAWALIHERRKEDGWYDSTQNG